MIELSGFGFQYMRRMALWMFRISMRGAPSAASPSRVQVTSEGLSKVKAEARRKWSDSS